MTLLRFNHLLEAAEVDPGAVCLMRHQRRLQGRPTPYAAWARDRTTLERYQATQAPRNRGIFASPYWASFVVTPDGGTLFTGLYTVRLVGTAPLDWIDPISGDRPADDADPADFYACARVEPLEPYAGLLRIAWGGGNIAWKQYAARNDKAIVALADRFVEPSFPGHLLFVSSFVDLPSVPMSWIAALHVKGVYLLCCPTTREQYVGSAGGADGFWGRWQNYVTDGHGGNEGLKSRDPVDYSISILEVAGSAATPADILAMEEMWKRKLRSRDMGLNRN